MRFGARTVCLHAACRAPSLARCIRRTERSTPCPDIRPPNFSRTCSWPPRACAWASCWPAFWASERRDRGHPAASAGPPSHRAGIRHPNENDPQGCASGVALECPSSRPNGKDDGLRLSLEPIPSPHDETRIKGLNPHAGGRFSANQVRLRRPGRLDPSPPPAPSHSWGRRSSPLHLSRPARPSFAFRRARPSRMVRPCRHRPSRLIRPLWPPSPGPSSGDRASAPLGGGCHARPSLARSPKANRPPRGGGGRCFGGLDGAEPR